LFPAFSPSRERLPQQQQQQKQQQKLIDLKTRAIFWLGFLPSRCSQATQAYRSYDTLRNQSFQSTSAD
jgi:hypothetical protein